MEIKLNAGDKITIPAGCKATIEDNQIIIKEQKEFKDGDILISKYRKLIVIFSNYKKDNKLVFHSYFNSANDPDDYTWFTEKFRPITEKEKQEFFDELKAKGLKWNAETKQMEKIIRRAIGGESYLYIDMFGDIYRTQDYHGPFDDSHYNLGNYYLLEEREQAEKDAERIKAIFKERIKLK